MSVIIYILIGIGFFIALSLIIWLIMIIMKPNSDFKESVLFLNFSSHFDRSKGCFIGAEMKNVGTDKDGRHYLEVIPKDVDIDTATKDIKIAKIIVDRNKYLSFPKGTLSANKNIAIGLPKSAVDLHEAVKDTILGKGIMLAAELQASANAEIASLSEGHLRKDEILKRIGNGEVSKSHIAMLDEFYKDALKMSLDSRGKSTTSSSIIPSSSKL